MYLDNCRIHCTLIFKDWAKQVGVPLVYGVPYMPAYCGIENFWSAVKRTYRSIGSKVMLSGKNRDLAGEAIQAVNAQSNSLARNCNLGGIKAILNIPSPADADDQD